MSTKFIAILSTILFLSTMISQAQPYELDWNNLNQSTVKAEDSYTLQWEDVDEHVDKAPDKVMAEAEEKYLVAVFPGRYSRVRPSPFQSQSKPWRQPAQPERNIDLTFSGRQFYDYYAERYKVVERIEVSVFRKSGGIFYQTYWNTGQYQNYEIYVNDLAMGDRYRAIIVWEDGSNRTLDQTLSSYSYTTVVVDQPDHLAYSYD